MTVNLSKPANPTSHKKLSGFSRYRRRQGGAVLIIVLWFIALMSLLVATLASEVRMAAKAVYYNQNNVRVWAKTLEALHLAQMELMIQRMPPPPEDSEIPLSERENPLMRFNGQVLQLSHPLPAGVTVRIYDHAGKINLRSLDTNHLRELLREYIGEDDLERLDALQQAWDDWKDADDLKRVNGAEKAYYKTLDPPYEPRNGLFETLEEIRLIKGFDEVFKDLSLSDIFTIYGGTYRVNPNYASADVLRILPGMTAAAVAEIIALREAEEIKNYSDLNEIIQAHQLPQLQNWLDFGNNGSSIYTIAIQVEAAAVDEAAAADSEEAASTEAEAPTPPASDNQSQHAFLATVQAKGYATPPRILKIEPYGTLPNPGADLSDEDSTTPDLQE